MFQSTLPARGATGPAGHQPCAKRFQSTLPARGATAAAGDNVAQLVLFQSTLPARGATLAQCLRDLVFAVSIHAPREGSDHDPWAQCARPRCFNPRSPRGERPRHIGIALGIRCFNPRSPRGERQMRIPEARRTELVSIHAPREGSDRGGHKCLIRCHLE